MKPKLPPVGLPHPVRPTPAPRLPMGPTATSRSHSHSPAHNVSRKAAVRVDAKDKEPHSTEETKADGQAFRDALFGSPSDSPTGVMSGPAAMGDFSEGGGNRQGQEDQNKKDERRDGRRASRVGGARAAGGTKDTASAKEVPDVSADQGWVELEIESRVAGRIRLSVLREAGRVRARLNVGNPMAAQWMRENVAMVERELADDLGCRVNLEIA